MPVTGIASRLPSWAGRWLAAAGAALLAILTAQHLWGIPGLDARIRMEPEKIKPDEGSTGVWRWNLPERYRTQLAGRVAVVLEDGELLGRRARGRGDMNRSGGPMFYPTANRLRFRPDLPGDPRTSGKIYEAEVPRQVAPWLIGLALALLAAGLYCYRPRVRDPLPTGEVRRSRKDLWIALAFTFAGWIWAGSVIRRSAEFNDGIMSINGMPYSDAVCWNEMALNAAEGRGLTGSFDGQRPFYAILTGILHAIRGPLATNGLWINAACHGMAAGIVYLLGRWLGSRAVGIGGAALMLVSADHTLLVRLLMTEASGQALTVLSVALALGAWRRRAPVPEALDATAPVEAKSPPAFRHWLLILSGLFFGLANLTCPFTLVAAPLYALILAGSAWRAGVLPRWKVLIPPAVFGLGLFLALAPWVARQKAVHGLGTISTQTADLLYSTTFPEGAQKARAAGKIPTAGMTQAERYTHYMKKFVEKVKEDPGAYAGIISRGMLEFFSFREVAQPAGEAAVVLVLLAGVWSRRRDPQRMAWLLAFCVVAPGMIAALRLAAAGEVPAPLLFIAAASTLTAFFLGPRACRPAIAWQAATLAGCALINALTGNVIARRCWIFADFALWLLYFAAGRAWLNHLARLLAIAARRPDRSPLPANRGPGEADARNFCTAAAAAVILFTMAGGAILLFRKPLPCPAAVPQDAALTEFTRTLLPENPQAAMRISVHTFQPGEYRSFIPAASEPTGFSRAFLRQNFDRTLYLGRFSDPSGCASLRMIRIPGNLNLPAREPHVLVSVVNYDAKAPFGHDVFIHEALAIIPVKGGAADLGAALKFPITDAIGTALAQPPPPEEDAGASASQEPSADDTSDASGPAEKDEAE